MMLALVAKIFGKFAFLVPGGWIAGLVSAVGEILTALIKSLVAVVTNPLTYPTVGIAFVIGWIMAFDHEHAKLTEYKQKIAAEIAHEKSVAEERVAAANEARALAERAAEEAAKQAEEAKVSQPPVQPATARRLRKSSKPANDSGGFWLPSFPAHIFKSPGSTD